MKVEIIGPRAVVATCLLLTALSVVLRLHLNESWGVRFSGDCRFLVVGVWDKKAYLYSTETWKQVGFMQRNDRVYSVSISHNADRIAVAGRDCMAVVYERTNLHEPIFTAEYPSFIYSVALSSSGRFLALGGVAKDVWLFDVDQRMELFRFRQDHVTWSVDFSSDERALCMGGESTCMDLWNIEDVAQSQRAKRILRMDRSDLVHSVRFGGSALGFCSGSTACLYGLGGDNAYGWEDRPGYEVAASMLSHPEGLQYMLSTWPALSNATNPQSESWQS